MRLLPFTPDYELSDFDCGDEDLNSFLFEDAKHFLEKRIANTFILEDEGKIVAYFCLLNDKVSRLEITNSRWKKIKDSFPEGTSGKPRDDCRHRHPAKGLRTGEVDRTKPTTSHLSNQPIIINH